MMYIPNGWRETKGKEVCSYIVQWNCFVKTSRFPDRTILIYKLNLYNINLPSLKLQRAYIETSGTSELSITEKYTYRVAEPQYASKFGT